MTDKRKISKTRLAFDQPDHTKERKRIHETRWGDERVGEKMKEGSKRAWNNGEKERKQMEREFK